MLLGSGNISTEGGPSASSCNKKSGTVLCDEHNIALSQVLHPKMRLPFAGVIRSATSCLRKNALNKVAQRPTKQFDRSSRCLAPFSCRANPDNQQSIRREDLREFCLHG